MILEDEPLIAIDLEDLLAEFGCRIVGVAGVEGRAFQILEAEEVDLAVLDINLGNGSNSYAVANALAERGIPFVYVSGYNSSGVRPQNRHRPQVQKPIDERELAAALKQALQDPVGAEPESS